MKPLLNLVSKRPSITSALIFFAVVIGVGVSIGIVAQTTDRGPDTGIIVVRFQPTGQTDRETNITVQFSNDMVSKDSLNLVLKEVPLEFNPPVAGLARWIETDILRFYPDAPLAPATRYQVTVLADRTYIHGNRIREEQTFRFETKPIAVTDISWRTEPAPGLPGRTRLYVDLTFNYQVNIDQLPELLSIKGTSDNTPKELSFEVDSYWGMRTDNLGVRYAKGVTVITEPFEVSDKTQTFTFRIAKGLTCDYCEIPLPAPYEAPIKLEGRRPLLISQVRPGIQDKQGVITAYFSSAVLDENLKKYVHVSPEKQMSIEAQYNRLLIRGDFKPGETYTVTIDPDLISQEGSKLGREFSTKVTIPDIPPSIEFTTPGIYLPENGSGLLETSSINVDSMSVEMDQIFANNLVYALAGGYDRAGPYSPQISRVGHRFFSKTIGVSGNLNEAHNTTIDVAGIIGDSARGIFRVAARNKNGRWSYDSRVVMITDIGIMARMSDNYLVVWANTLSELKPVTKATVTVYSINNQELLSGETDSRGIAVFSNISEKLKGFEPFVITVSTGKDLSYLKFDQTMLEMSTFDISGRPYLESGYEAFVYSDRGVYRPGDTVHFASVVRGRNAAVPPEFPYALTIRDPSGRKFESYQLNTGTTGFQEQNFAVPDFARSGKYSAIAHIGKDYVIGRLEFQVEEFVPDKIKVTVSTARDAYSAGDTIDIDVNAVYLFGPPAANLNVSGHVTIEEHAFAPRRWSDYTFTDPNRKFSRTDIDLKDHQLNDSGQYTYTYVLPDNLKPPSDLTVLFAADVSEPGGRAVSGYKSILLNPYPTYVGLRFDFEGYAKPGERIGAELIALSPAAKPTAIDSVRLSFYRVVYHTVLQQDTRGRYRYISERMPKLIDSTMTSISDTGSIVYFTPPQYGSYEVVAEDLHSGHRSSRSFYASGWGYAPWAMAQPDRIEIDLDKTAYEPGEQAAVQVRSPFGGKLLVTVEKESVLEFITFDMDSNTAEFTIPIKKDYAPNAYVTATVIRRGEDVSKTSPARAFGIAPIRLSNSDRAISVTIDAPEVVRPKTELSVTVNTNAGENTRLTLAAVDVGILQLTGFTVPDPMSFFYGQRAPGLKPYDIYSFIYPDIPRAESHLSPAGGQALKLRRLRHLNPITARRIKPVALWSGIVTADEKGRAVLKFNIPQFNGKLTLMAVAVNEDKFGSAERDVTVRDKIVVQESFPRFVSPNDLVDGLVTVFNHSGSRANIDVSLKIDGPATSVSPLTQTIALDDNAERNVIFQFRAGLVPGPVKLTITAASGSEKTSLNFELPNRPAMPLVTKYGSGAVTADSNAQFTLPDEWIAKTDEYIIQTSSLAAVELTRQIDFLLKYPYGCAEQTTSRLFPLLYFSDLVRFARPDLIGTRGADYFIQEGILKLVAMMRPDGMFQSWPSGDKVHYWTTVYASHFLLEANKAGFAVDNSILNTITDNLRQIAEGKREEADLPSRVYAAYALGRAGKLERRTVNYIRTLNAENMTAYSRFLVAGVLAAAGDSSAARQLLPAEIQPAIFDPVVGGNFSSGVRTNAILLQVLMQIAPNDPSAAVLAKSLMETARVGRWYTTQATSFGLMALGEYLSKQAVPNYTGTVRVTNDTTWSIDTTGSRTTLKGIGGKSVRIFIDGTGPCFYYWQASGIPVSQAPEEFSHGIKVTREYLDDAGNLLDMQSVPLGSQVICHIRAEAVNQRLTNVVINDLLPAALEIENPRLKTTPRLRWIPKSGRDIDYQDIRDDRLLIFVSIDPKQPVDFYYSLRAIAAGDFTVPPISAECMYNPLIAGSGSSGILTVKSSVK